jgi:two-component system cell cycle sensor histidine kinase/response regulator CckA
MLVDSEFQRYFEKLPIGVAFLDRENHVRECNGAFRSLVEFDFPIGEPFTRFISEDLREATEAYFQAVLNGSDQPKPLDATLSSGSDRSVTIFGAPFYSAPSKPPSILLHLVETTEQKRLEARFAQSQKMQAVGQLAGGIAHDFNNLLTAMIGFCDLLLQRYRPGEQAFADVMQIKQNANRGASLVRQLLAFSRQQTLQPQRLLMADVLSELSNLLRRLIGEAIELKMVHGRDLGAVKVDQGQLEQVIINLVVNARDAMRDGGQLIIETANRSVTRPFEINGETVMPGEYVILSVRDTGIGIDADTLEHIFEPFFTTKEVGSGTGLGLSTVYGIVTQTGGHILAESGGIGRGASFTIYFHRDVSKQEETGEDAAEHEGPLGDVTGGGSVLLVEDEDPVRLFGARALRSKGYKVIEARTGEAALKLLRTTTFDLLITDMVMPKVGGAEVIKAARAADPGLPVICISGYTQESIAREVESIENMHFLAKPFSLKQLAGTVKNAIVRTDELATGLSSSHC